MRFMVDRDIVGCNWLSLTQGKWRQRPWTSSGGIPPFTQPPPFLPARPFAPSAHTQAYAELRSRLLSTGGISAKRQGLCQLEVDVWFADLVSHKPEGEWMHTAPMRTPRQFTPLFTQITPLFTPISPLRLFTPAAHTCCSHLGSGTSLRCASSHSTLSARAARASSPRCEQKV